METDNSSHQSPPSEIPPHSSVPDADPNPNPIPNSISNPSEKRKRESDDEPEQVVTSSEQPEEAAAEPEQNPFWKTTLCSYFRRTGGTCSHGESCRYAHGEAELRQRPDNTWDPTSERAKKMARTERNQGKEEEEKAAADVGVMMTEALEAEGEGEESASSLSKCFVNLPMKWSADHLRSFLREQVL